MHPAVLILLTVVATLVFVPPLQETGVWKAVELVFRGFAFVFIVVKWTLLYAAVAGFHLGRYVRQWWMTRPPS